MIAVDSKVLSIEDTILPYIKEVNKVTKTHEILKNYGLITQTIRGGVSINRGIENSSYFGGI